MILQTTATLAKPAQQSPQYTPHQATGRLPHPRFATPSQTQSTSPTTTVLSLDLPPSAPTPPSLSRQQTQAPSKTKTTGHSRNHQPQSTRRSTPLDTQPAGIHTTFPHIPRITTQSFVREPLVNVSAGACAGLTQIAQIVTIPPRPHKLSRPIGPLPTNAATPLQLSRQLALPFYLPLPPPITVTPPTPANRTTTHLSLTRHTTPRLPLHLSQ